MERSELIRALSALDDAEFGQVVAQSRSLGADVRESITQKTGQLWALVKSTDANGNRKEGDSGGA